MAQVYLGLGSNRGDSPAILASAFRALSGLLREARLSSLYVSAPREVTDQPDFVNAAVAGGFDGPPRDLLEAIHRIETDHGRDRSRERPKGPRSLDIDILAFGDLLLAESDLVIPHPALRERKFALLPLVELAPGLRDPATGELFLAHLARLPAQGIYLLDSPHYDHLYL